MSSQQLSPDGGIRKSLPPHGRISPLAANSELPGFPPHLHQVSPQPSTDVLRADQVHLRPGEFLPADHCQSGQEAALPFRAGGGGGGGHQEVLGQDFSLQPGKIEPEGPGHHDDEANHLGTSLQSKLPGHR